MPAQGVKSELSIKQIVAYIVYLQIVITFGAIPVVILGKVLGESAVLIYSLVSIVIIAAITAWLTWKGRDKNRDPELSALTFGLVVAFIMSEFVAALIVMSP